MSPRPLDNRAAAVPARASVITVGAHDFAALRDFYRALGWPLAEDLEDYAAFALRGAEFAVFPRPKLAHDAQAEPAGPERGLRFTISMIVDRPEQVDVTIDAVRKAGGRITKEPVDGQFFVGRSAYFADPEDNYWEVAWAPDDNAVVAATRRGAGQRLDRDSVPEQ
jgi:predicted lactoylglutathione lyase